MTTRFSQYAFAPSLPGTAGHERTMPARLAEEVNVKDFGAVGDGSTDDTTAIQDAFNFAFGSITAPHGQNCFQNKTVFFPAGIYKVTSTLQIKWLRGGHVRGAGRDSTIIKYMGPIAGGHFVPKGMGLSTGTRTSLFQTDGCWMSRFDGLSFQVTGGAGSSGNDFTVAFNLDWADNGPGNVNLADILFTNCAFYGATVGMLIATSDLQGDTVTWINCVFDDCLYAVVNDCQNAIASGMLGGRISRCYIGMATNSGVCQKILGTFFADNAEADINDTTGTPSLYVGCYSESANFFNSDWSSPVIIACRHNSNLTGNFCRINKGTPNPNAVLFGNYSKNGSLWGDRNPELPVYFYLSCNQFDSASWLGRAAYILEYKTLGSIPLTWASLPNGWQAEGLVVSTSQSAVNPIGNWGANVSGSGSYHAMLHFNGANWTIMGA